MNMTNVSCPHCGKMVRFDKEMKLACECGHAQATGKKIGDIVSVEDDCNGEKFPVVVQEIFDSLTSRE